MADPEQLNDLTVYVYLALEFASDVRLVVYVLMPAVGVKETGLAPFTNTM